MAATKSTPAKSYAEVPHTTMVMVRTNRARDYGNGLIGIEVPVRSLTDAERAMLADLFPTLVDRAYQLLDQEALLSVIHTGPLPPTTKYDIIEPDVPF